MGSGGMATKVEAARIATGSGIPVVLAAAEQAAAALAGEPVGTYFHPHRERPATRLLWLAHATEPRGRLHLDAGAVRAVVDRRLSLLPAGITAVDGTFVRRRPRGPRRARRAGRGTRARGFDARELPALLGRSTRELAGVLGAASTSARSSTATTWSCCPAEVVGRAPARRVAATRGAGGSRTGKSVTGA